MGVSLEGTVVTPTTHSTALFSLGASEIAQNAGAYQLRRLKRRVCCTFKRIGWTILVMHTKRSLLVLVCRLLPSHNELLFPLLFLSFQCPNPISQGPSGFGRQTDGCGKGYTCHSCNHCFGSSMRHVAWPSKTGLHPCESARGKRRAAVDLLTTSREK